MFHSGYSVSLCCSVYCLCVNVHCFMYTTRPAGHTNIACVTSSRFASYGYSLALDGYESWVSYCGRITPGERSSPRTFWIGGWVGPRTNLDAVSRIEPRFLGWLAHSPSRHTDYAVPAPELHHGEKCVTQWDGRNRFRPRKLALAVYCADMFGRWQFRTLELCRCIGYTEWNVSWFSPSRQWPSGNLYWATAVHILHTSIFTDLTTLRAVHVYCELFTAALNK